MKQNLIEYILVKKGYKQVDLAKMLGVSRAQISKWKSGESIPYSRQEDLMKIAGLSGHNPEWAMFVENDINEQAWFEYIRALFENDFIDYKMPRTISDQDEIYVPEIILQLLKLGFNMPKHPPLDDLDAEDDEASDLTYFMSDILESFAMMSEWCDSYLPMHDNDNDEIFDLCLQIYSCLASLSIGYVEKELLTTLRVDFDVVKRCGYDAKLEIQQFIKEIYKIMYRDNIPVVTDYFTLINKSPYDLDDYILFDNVAAGETLEDNLPYFERTLLRKAQYTNDLLEILISKFEGKEDDRRN